MDPERVRRKIARCIKSENFQTLDGKYNIKLLLDRDKFTVLTDCLGYIIGTEDHWNIGKRVMEYFLPENKLVQPEPLSLAVYGSSTEFANFRHLGIVNQNLTIISKWGLAPVFEHPVMHVPKSYGEQVEYFRVDINKIFKLCHPSLIQFLNSETSLPIPRN